MIGGKRLSGSPSLSQAMLSGEKLPFDMDAAKTPRAHEQKELSGGPSPWTPGRRIGDELQAPMEKLIS